MNIRASRKGREVLSAIRARRGAEKPAKVAKIQTRPIAETQMRISGKTRFDLGRHRALVSGERKERERERERETEQMSARGLRNQVVASASPPRCLSPHRANAVAEDEPPTSPNDIPGREGLERETICREG